MKHRIEALFALAGWRRSLALFAAGALAVLSFAPFYLWPLLCLSIPIIFIYLNNANSTRRAVLDGFFYGYGFFMVGTYWIAISMTVEAEKFAWMIPFSVLGLSAVLALSFALLGMCYYALKTRSLTANLATFCVLWVGMELLRSWGMFGFPWNLLGYSLVSIPAVLQLAAILGIYGLSLLAVMVGLMLVPLFYEAEPQKKWRFSILTMGCFVAAYAWGVFYMQAVPSKLSDIRIRIVQANIPQAMKWDVSQKRAILETHKRLSQLESNAPSPDIVVWPESAIPEVLRTGSEWTQYLPEMLPEGAILFSGVMREDSDGRYYNSLAAFGEDGSVLATYDKRQLVPFGEFVPLRDLLPLDKIAPSPIDFTRGAPHQNFAITHVPNASPIICYESAFPWLAHTRNEAPSDWMLLVTNDAWFGTSIGPHQHFSMAQVRAVEQGIPVIRSANTGISGMIDIHGMVVKNLGVDVRGVVDVALPDSYKSTIYNKIGLAGILTILLTIYLLSRRYSYTT